MAGDADEMRKYVETLKVERKTHEENWKQWRDLSCQK